MIVMMVILYSPLLTGAMTTIVPKEERILLCPGDTVQYLCVSPGVNTISWNLLCPEHHPPGFTISVDSNNDSSLEFNCSGQTFHCITTFMNESQSSINITVFNSLMNSQNLRIDCEDSGNHRFLEVPGLQSPYNLSLSHHFNIACGNDTHISTTFSWSMKDELNNVEGYSLNISPTRDDIIEESNMLTNASSRNITAALRCNMTYIVSLHAIISCQSALNGDSFSINVSTPGCSPGTLERGRRDLETGHQCNTLENTLESEDTSQNSRVIIIVVAGGFGIVILLLISVVTMAMIFLLNLKFSVKYSTHSSEEAVYEVIPSERTSGINTVNTNRVQQQIPLEGVSDHGLSSVEISAENTITYSVPSELDRNYTAHTNALDPGQQNTLTLFSCPSVDATVISTTARDVGASVYSDNQEVTTYHQSISQ